MNESFYRITLDIKSIQSQISLPIKQGDTSRGIYISLTDGGKPYVIAEKCFAIFKGNKSDGTEVGNNCYIENNRIVYPITKETVTSPGIVECEVSLYNSEGGLITTPRFTLVVDSRAVGGEQYTSKSEYTSLESFLSRVADGETKLQQIAERITGSPISALYSHFGVDKSAYPCVLISWDKPTLRIRFLKNYTFKDGGISYTDFWLGAENVGTYEPASYTAYGICEAVLEKISTVEKSAVAWGTLGISTKWYANTSFANILKANGFESVVEIPEETSMYELGKQISDVVTFVTNELALKEDVKNKVDTITDTNSKYGLYYPTAKAVVDYVNSQGGSGSSDYDGIIADITERLDAIENNAGKEYTPLVETADYTFEKNDNFEDLCSVSLNNITDVSMLEEGVVCKVTVGDTVDSITTVKNVNGYLIIGNLSLVGMGNDTGETYIITIEEGFPTILYRATEGTYKVGISIEGVGSGGADITLLDEQDFEDKKDNDVYNAIAIDNALMVFAQILMVVCDKLGIDFEAMLSLSGGESDG